MAKAYLNRNDVQMRLDRSLVRWEGQFFYCDVMTPTNDWWEVNLHYLGDEKRKGAIVVDHRDARFDSSSPEIGYFNVGGSSYYAQRKPARRQVQGLNLETLVVTPRCPHGNYLTSQGFHDMLKAVYPNRDEAIAQLRLEQVRGIAVSRQFAFKWMDGLKIGVFHRDRMVGYIAEHSNDTIIIPDQAASFVTRQARKSGVMS